MAQYIDKNVLIAEIKRRRDLHFKNYVEKGFESSEGKYDEDKHILSFINTLEVKKVDLEKEIKDYFNGWTEDEYNGAACHYQYVNLQDCKSIAKYFFELGLKAQKGE